MGLRRKKKFKRRKGILYDYNGDCRFEEERIKGFWKHYWRKWDLRRIKKEMIEE